MRVLFAFLVVFLVSAPIIMGAPIAEEDNNLLNYENVRTENGYRFSYETKDGQAREEVGVFDPATNVMTVTGWYSYQTPDGVTHRVDFVADENGYRTMKQSDSEEEFEAPFVEAAPINNALLLSLVG